MAPGNDVIIALDAAAANWASRRKAGILPASQMAWLAMRSLRGTRAESALPDALLLAPPTPGEVAGLFQELQGAARALRRALAPLLPDLRFGAPEDALLYLAAREAVVLRRIVASLRETGIKPLMAACTDESRSYASIAAALLGVPLQTVEEDSPRSSPRGVLSPSEKPQLEGGRTPLNLLALFGVPDPAFHLRRLINDVEGDLLIVLDERHCGRVEDILAWAANQPRAHVLLLFGIAWERHRASFERDLRDRLISASGQNASIPMMVWRALEEVLLPLWANVAATRAAIFQIAAHRPVRGVSLSEHLSVATPAMLELARGKGVPVEILAHGGWPIPMPMAAPAEIVEGRYRAWTRTATRLAAERYHPGPLLPLTRHAPLQHRIRRTVRRTIATVRRRWRGRIQYSVGVLLTSGQSALAADIDPAELLAALRILVAGLQGRSDRLLVVRTREAEDIPAYYRARLAQVLPGGEDIDGALLWRRTGKDSMLHFLDEVDLVIELGAPTSAILEAMAQKRIVLRWPLPPFDSRSHPLIPENLSPRIDAHDPWSDVEKLISDRGAMVALARRQHAWLRAETEERGRSRT